jgi:DNA-directed RNA polymerase subunit RPC12/RpoP
MRDGLASPKDELALPKQENSRRADESEYSLAELARMLADLMSSYWHIKKSQDVLPVCMECGRVKAGEEWEDVIKYLSENALRLSHGYCPECIERILSKPKLPSDCAASKP